MQRAGVFEVALFIGFMLAAADAARGDSLATMAGRLRAAKSNEELHSIVVEVSSYRLDLAGGLAGLLASSSSSKDLKARACYLVGQFRGWQTANDVIANVDLESIDAKGAPWGRYPCQEALIKLGRRVDRHIMMALARVDDGGKRQRLVNVMVTWYGPCKTVAMLQEAIANERGEGAQRLAEALKIAVAAIKKPGA